MHDGSITFSTELDNAQLEKDLERLKKKVLRQGEALGRMKFKKNDLDGQLKAVNEELDKLQRKTKVSGDRFLLEPQDIERIALLKSTIPGIEAEINKCTDAIHNSNRELEYTKIRAGEIYSRLADIRKQSRAEAGRETAENRIKEIFGRIQEYSKAPLQSTKSLFEELFQSIGRGFVGIGQSMAAVVKRIPGLFETASSGALRTINELTSGIAAAAKRITTLVGEFNAFPRMFNSIGESFSRLGQMIRRVFVFSAVTSGLRAVRDQLSAYLGINTKFSNALQQLKGVLLTAFQPIYDAVVPALTTLMSILSRAIVVIAQFTSVLFGTTAKQAQKNAKALYDQAKAAEAVGSAAEEAAGSLASFDEINHIQTEKQAGGGGVAAEAGPLFEWEYEDTPFPDWGEAFDALLDKLIAGIPHLKDVFKSFADWLNGLAQKLYDMFKFPGVLEKVKQLGKDLAGAFNDFVNWINWELLGGSLGAGLNLALNFLTSFIYEFDWINLGAKLADFVNGLVYEIDWHEFGRLLWAKFKIGIETFAGFLLNLDMPELAKAASNIIKGFFDSMTETLQNIDWREIGNQIGKFISGIDWFGVLSSAFEAIKEAIMDGAEFVIGLIEGLSPEMLLAIGVITAAIILGLPALVASIGATIAAAIASLPAVVIAAGIAAIAAIIAALVAFIKSGGGDVILGFLEGILDGIKNIASWLKEHVVDPLIKGFCDLFGIHSPSTVMAELGGYLMDGLLSGINDAIAPVVELFESIFNDFVTFVEGVFTGNWKKAWEGVSGIFKDVWNGIVSTLEGAVNLIIRGINWLISKLNAIHFSIPDWVPAVGGKSFGINIPTIPEAKIPRLAQGAVIPPNREFMAVLGDQRSGNNLEAPEGLIRKIVREESSGGSAELIQLLQSILTAVKEGHIIMVDGTTFGRTAIRTINSANTAAGKQLLLI